LGMSLKLDAFRVCVDPPGLVPEAGDDTGHWRVAQMRPTPDHVLALACRQSGPAPLVLDVEEKLGEMCHPPQTPRLLLGQGPIIDGGSLRESVLCTTGNGLFPPGLT
jgi:hypothetical protein